MIEKCYLSTIIIYDKKGINNEKEKECYFKISNRSIWKTFKWGFKIGWGIIKFA